MGETSRTLVWVVITALVVGAGVYVWAQGNIQIATQQAFQAGYQAGMAAVTPAPEPVSLSISKTGGDTFDLTSEIASDGSATNTTKELALTIENTDNVTAEFKILLKNPKTNEEGLPGALENSYFNVYYEIGSTIVYMYKDAEYKDTPEITLPADSVMTLNIGVELEDAPAGTFADGQSYTMKVYVYQPDANYVQEISYTVNT